MQGNLVPVSPQNMTLLCDIYSTYFEYHDKIIKKSFKQVCTSHIGCARVECTARLCEEVNSYQPALAVSL